MIRSFTPGPAVFLLTLFFAGCSSGAAEDRQALNFVEIQREELLGGADPAVLARAENEVVRRQQEGIADCMIGAGFDYEPYVQEISPEAFADFSSIDWAREHGFGVVDDVSPGPQSEPTSDDPNLGSPLANTPEYAEMLERCTTEAIAEVNDAIGVMPLRDQQHRVYDAIASDPQVVAAGRDWANCAAAAGYPAASRTALIQDFLARALAADPATLPELRSDEVDAALATFDCSLAFDTVWRERGDTVAEALLGDLWTSG